MCQKSRSGSLSNTLVVKDGIVGFMGFFFRSFTLSDVTLRTSLFLCSNSFKCFIFTLRGSLINQDMALHLDSLLC